LNTLVSARNPEVLGEFAQDALLVGSEEGEIAEGHEALAALFQRLFDQPLRVSWEWQRVRASSVPGVAWLFAEGHVVIVEGAEEKRVPYRLSGVLHWQHDRWVWRQFNGSEPV